MISNFSNHPKRIKENKVVFKDLKPKYNAEESILVEISLPVEIEKTASDWVGLIAVGWKTVQQYVTFEWLKDSRTFEPWSAKSRRTITKALLFRSQFHKHDVTSGELYEFIYVHKQIEVLGTSSVFKFDTSLTNDALDLLLTPSFHYSSLPSLHDNEGLQNLATCHSELKVEANLMHLKKEKKSVMRRCETNTASGDHELRKSDEFLGDLMSSLDRQREVQIVGGGRKMWVKKVDGSIVRRKVLKLPITQKELVLVPKKSKASAIVKYLQHLSELLEDRLLTLIGVIADYPSPIHYLWNKLDILFMLCHPFKIISSSRIFYSENPGPHHEINKMGIKVNRKQGITKIDEDNNLESNDNYKKALPKSNFITPNELDSQIVGVYSKEIALDDKKTIAEIRKVVESENIARTGALSWTKENGELQFQFTPNPDESKFSGGIDSIVTKKVNIKIKIPQSAAPRSSKISAGGDFGKQNYDFKR